MVSCITCKTYLSKNLVCSQCQTQYTWRKKLNFTNVFQEYYDKAQAKFRNAKNIFNIPVSMFDGYRDYIKLNNNFLSYHLKPSGFYDYDNDCEEYELIEQSTKKKYKFLIISAYYPKTFIVELDKHYSKRDAFLLAGIWFSHPIDKEYYDHIKSEIELPFTKVQGKARSEYMSHTIYESYFTDGEYIKFSFGS